MIDIVMLVIHLCKLKIIVWFVSIESSLMVSCGWSTVKFSFCMLHSIGKGKNSTNQFSCIYVYCYEVQEYLMVETDIK